MAKKTDGNYYMSQGIAQSGVAPTSNPAFLSTQEYQPFQISARQRNIGDYFTSDSKNDEYLGDISGAIEDGLVVDDLRANAQSGWDMVANAIANNLVIAGTTAVSSTVGLVDGLLEAAIDQDMSKLWDNATTNYMTDIQEAAKEAMPIYRGNQYEDKSLLGKMGTGIFWADLVENLGYTEGMLIPGAGLSKAMMAAPKIAKMTIPSLVSSMGEAAQEAINTRNDEVKNKQQLAINRYNEIAQTISPDELPDLQIALNQTMEDIEADANNAGNFVYGANIALLTLSNTIEFGSLFSRGFGTAKRLKGAISRKGGEYSQDALGIYLGKAVGKKTLDSFSEGVEEVSQSIISNTPQNYTDYNTFNESMFNPEKRELVGDLVSALGQSYAQALDDKATAEEFASGFLIGAIGVPMLKRGVVPIKFENSIIGEVRDAYSEYQSQKNLAETINQRLKDNKKFNAYYNGLVRHLTLQDRMNAALDNSDTKQYKDAESAQFISDISMFDNAGDIQYFRDLVNNSIDTSDEGLKILIQETSKDGEGPFMQNGNPMSIEEVRRIIEEKKQVLNNKIDNYLKDKNSLETSNPNMDSDTLNNVLFLRQQHRDHSERLQSLSSDTSNPLSSLLKDFNVEQGIDEQRNYINPTLLPNLYGKDKKYTEGVDALINWASSQSKITEDQAVELRQNLSDIVKLRDNLIDINSNIKDLLNNPQKSRQEKQNRYKKREIEKEAKDTVTKLDKINNTSVSDISKSIDEGDINMDDLDQLLSDEEVAQSTKDKLEEVNSIRQADQEARAEVNNMLSNGEISEQEAQDINDLLDKSKEVSESVDELLDTDSEIFNDPRNLSSDDSTDQIDIEEAYQQMETRLDSARATIRTIKLKKQKVDQELNDIPKTNPRPSDNSPSSQTGHDAIDKNEPVNAPRQQQVISNADIANKIFFDIGIPANSWLAKNIEEVLDYADTYIKKGINGKELRDFLRSTISYSNVAQYDSKVINALHQAINNKVSKEAPNVEQQTSKQVDTIPEVTPQSIDEQINLENNKEFLITDAALEEATNEGTTVSTSKVNGIYNYWRGSTTEFPIHRERGNDTPYWQTVNTPARERYRAVYEYLKNYLAFSRIKNNQVRKGDEVHFGISRELTEKIGKPVILILNQNNEVIGDLPIPDDSTFNSYIGLPQLYEGASNWYKENRNNLHTDGNDIAVIPGYKSNIARNMVGKPQYTSQSERHTLNQISTITTSDGSQKQVSFRLGIAIADADSERIRIMSDAGRSKSQGASPLERTIIPPLRAVKGQPFLLMPTSSKTKAFVTVPIMMPSFDSSNQKIMNSALGKAIQTKVQELTTIPNNTDQIMKWVNSMQELLAIPEIHVNFTPPSFTIQGRQPEELVVSIRRQGDTKSTILYKGLKENAVDSVLNGLSGSMFQVSRKYINDTYGDRSYNEMIGELAETNLPIGAIHTINDWFTIDPIVDKKQQKAHSPKSTRVNPTQIQGTVIRFQDASGNSYYMTNSNRLYKENSEGNDIEVTDSKYNYLKAHAYGIRVNETLTRPYDTPWGYYNPQTGKFETKPSQVTSDAQKLTDTLQKLDQLDQEARQIAQQGAEALKQASEAEIKAMTNEELIHATESLMVTATTHKEAGRDALASEMVKKANTYQNELISRRSLGANNRQNSIDALSKMGLLNKKERNSALDKLSDDRLAQVASMPKLRARQILERFDTRIKANMDSSAINDVFDSIIDSKPLNREVTNQMSKEKSWSRESEIKKMSKILPQLNEDGRVRVVNGLIKIARAGNSAYAWGQFQNGIITLSDRAARGTMYHESFHFVTQTLLSLRELNNLYRDAEKQYGKLSKLELEERLAEDFREFMQSYEDDVFFKNIFKMLKHIIKSLIGKETITNKLFHDIRRGALASRNIKPSLGTLNRVADDIAQIEDELSKARREGNREIAEIDMQKASLDKAISDKQLNWQTVNKVRLVKLKQTGYQSPSEAYADIPKKYNRIADVVEIQGRHYIVYKVNGTNTRKESIRKYISELEQDKKYLIDNQEYLESQEALDDQETYYREVEQYHREKFDYGKLNQEQKDYITERGLSIEEYNLMTPQQKEVFFKCLY